MTLFDLPLAQLREYVPVRQEPANFDSFWQQTLTDVHRFPVDALFERVDWGLGMVETYDVSFNGYAGEPIKGWLLLPVIRSSPLPCVVEFVGYGGGRGQPIDWLLWSSVGYAHLVMDTRGQGSTWRSGDTPDHEPIASNPHYPGFMTRGILDPASYYYRRVFSDAVRAVEAAMSHSIIDASRIAVAGHSQGGGIALAVCALVEQVTAALIDVPLLCDCRTATEITETAPYNEITNYLKVHRDKVDKVFATLSYFDGINFAVRGKAPALFSVGLMDDNCPPRTVFAAYNHYAGSKQIKVWPYNAHEGGQSFQELEKIKFLKLLWG